jgi:hypothetical protein
MSDYSQQVIDLPLGRVYRATMPGAAGGGPTPNQLRADIRAACHARSCMQVDGMTCRRVVVIVDYCCGYPLRITDEDGQSAACDPRSLQTSNLSTRLMTWHGRIDVTLNHAYPPDSGFASPADEDAFHADRRSSPTSWRSSSATATSLTTTTNIKRPDRGIERRSACRCRT